MLQNNVGKRRKCIEQDTPHTYFRYRKINYYSETKEQ